MPHIVSVGSNPNQLFVYGTLSTAIEHPLGTFMRQVATPDGRGSFGGRLYVLDDPDDRGRNSYPGALLSTIAGERVYGELYTLTDSETAFARLDPYENCSVDFPEPHEFVRSVITVDMGLGRQVQAWTYLYNYEWNLATAVHLVGGRYAGESWSEAVNPADTGVFAVAR